MKHLPVLLVLALVALGCGAEPAPTPAGAQALMEARVRGSVTESPEGFAIGRGPLKATVAHADPRQLRLATPGHVITVHRLATGTATARLADDRVEITSEGEVEATLFATPRGIEELVVSSDDLRYRLELPMGWALRATAARSDAVDVVGPRGVARLRMVAPRAWDEHGQAHPLLVSAERDEIVITLPRDAGRWLVDPEWQWQGPDMLTRRCGTTALLGDGQVLISGPGCSMLVDGDLFNLHAELVDPENESGEQVGELSAVRCTHTATLLSDGRALIVGGDATGSVEAYDPETQQFADIPVEPAASNVARQLHTATGLRDGRVLVVGGFEPFIEPVAPDSCEESVEAFPEPTVALASVQLFDPGTDTWHDSTPLPVPLGNHRASLLSDGRVLVSGGQSVAWGPASAGLWLFDPAGESWSQLGSLGQGRHGHAAMLLPQLGAAGQVLIAGGFTELAPGPEHWGNVTATAELVDLLTGQVIAAPPLSEARAGITTMMLPSGDPLLVGGGTDLPLTSPTVERFDVGAGQFVAEPPVYEDLVPEQPPSLTGTMLPSGHPWVALSGGMPHEGPALRYDPGVAELVDLGVLIGDSLHMARLCPLSTGEVLVFADDGMPVYSFDPETGTAEPWPGIWTCFGTRLTPLVDGTVLTTCPVPGTVGEAKGMILDPQSKTATETGPMVDPDRAEHSATLLPDGSVLLVGGAGDSAASAERYDPATGQFSEVEMAIEDRGAGHVAVLAVDGRVWLFGGCGGVCPVQIYDPADGSVETLAGTDLDGEANALALMDGRILLAAGGVLSLVDPAAKTVTNTGVSAYGGAPLALLPSGRVLLVDGQDLRLLQTLRGGIEVNGDIATLTGPEPKLALMVDGGVLIAPCQFNDQTGEQTVCLLYESQPPDDSWRPRLDPPPAAALSGQTLQLTGDNLLGLVEPTDAPTAGRGNHPVVIFMPFRRAPTVGGFRQWTDTEVQYTPRPVQSGPGYLFASVAGQLGGAPLTIMPAATGTPCNTANDCQSGICRDGVCCERLCDPCEACAATLKTDGPDGTCGPALADTDPHDDCEPEDVTTCGHNGACDGAGQCAFYPDDTECDEGRICRDQACSEGCTSDLDCPNGFACIDHGCADRCSSNLHCQEGLICGPDGACRSPLEPAEPIGCVPCASAPGRGPDAARWWLLVATALVWQGRRRRRPDLVPRLRSS